MSEKIVQLNEAVIKSELKELVSVGESLNNELLGRGSLVPGTSAMALAGLLPLQPATSSGMLP